MRPRLLHLVLIAASVTAAAYGQNQGPAPVPCVIGGVNQVVSPSGNTATDTSNIQNAMNACTTVGTAAGHPVYVQLAPGSYTITPIFMRSYVYLLIPSGVVVNASTNASAYQIAGSGTCGTIASSSSGCMPLISAGNNSQPAANYTGIIGSRVVGLMGGTINGHGWDVITGPTAPSTPTSWWQVATTANAEGKKQICPRLIEFDQGQNIVLRDITLEDSPYFHVVFSQCSYVTATDITIQTPSSLAPSGSGTPYNTDGIDPISSTFISITNCHITDGDDNIAITAASKGPSHDITIQNNRFGPGHGISIGSGTNAGVYNIYVKDAFFNGTDNGLRIKSDDSEGGEVQHIFYDTICMRAINTGSKSSKNGAINFDTQYSSSTGTLYPYYTDIHLHDVYSDTDSATIAGKAWDNFRLNGAGSPATEPISNVSFYNVNFNEPKTATVANINPATIYLYSNSVNVTIPGVTVTPAPSVDPFFNESANPNIVGYCQQQNP